MTGTAAAPRSSVLFAPAIPAISIERIISTNGSGKTVARTRSNCGNWNKTACKPPFFTGFLDSGSEPTLRFGHSPQVASHPMQHIRALVNDEFNQVNKLVVEQLHSNVPLVENIGHYIVDAGGKRLR